MTYAVRIQNPNSKPEIRDPFAKLQTGVYDNWRIGLHNGEVWILDGVNEGVRINLSSLDTTVTIREPGNSTSVSVEDVAFIEWRSSPSLDDE